MIARLPNVRLAVQWNRAFLRRVVRYLVTEAGIRQIVDIGAGLPTAGNTHEIALQACPGPGWSTSTATRWCWRTAGTCCRACRTRLSRLMSAAGPAIGQLVAGMEIIEPGLARPPEWRPDAGEQVPANAAGSYYCVVIARKP